VTSARRSQSVARALCALPVMPSGTFSCPAGWAISYRLVFTGRAGRLAPVTAEASGCQVVTGLGAVRWTATSPGFWRTLAQAAGITPADGAVLGTMPRSRLATVRMSLPARGAWHGRCDDRAIGTPACRSRRTRCPRRVPGLLRGDTTIPVALRAGTSTRSASARRPNGLRVPVGPVHRPVRGVTATFAGSPARPRPAMTGLFQATAHEVTVDAGAWSSALPVLAANRPASGPR
jgi:hypothetical protein